MLTIGNLALLLKERAKKSPEDRNTLIEQSAVVQ